MSRRTLLLGTAGVGAGLFSPAVSGCARRGALGQPGRVPLVGVVSAAPPADSPLLEVFRAGLRGQGYFEGRDVRLEIRHGDGWDDGCRRAAQEVAHLGADVIVAEGSTATVAAVLATEGTATPVVGIGLTSDPVADRLAASLDRPGGRVTGSCPVVADGALRRILILSDLLPTLDVLGVLFNPGARGTDREYEEVAVAALALGARAVPLEARLTAHLPAAFQKAERTRVDGMVVVGDAFTTEHQRVIVAEAQRRGIPTIHGVVDGVEAGGLAAYGPRLAAMYGRAALYLDLILRGASPGELPIERAAPELAINLRTARSLDLGVPSALLRQASELIDEPAG